MDGVRFDPSSVLVYLRPLVLMNLIFWNIRGVWGSGKTTVVRNLALSRCPTLMGIVEPKHSSLSHRKLRSWWFDDNFDWEDVMENEGSGGSILIWDKSKFHKTSCLKGDR